MPPPATSQQLFELIRKSGILSAQQITEAEAKLGDQPLDPTRTASLLVRHGFITPFQAKLLLAGRYKGFLLGSYVIREQIGQGGMGSVYLAHHQTLNRLVAIKVLSPAAGSNKLAVERFLREARAVAALDHPNIVRLFDVGKQDDLHFLVMEFVEGQTLDKMLENGGALSAGKAVEYIIQVAAGLQHAYEKGFIHRDIKPGNLILAKDGTIKILDMGLARSLESSDKLTEILDQGAVVGTADYISPEQAMNHPIDIRSDIYSLGATMFTLITGRTLYEGNTTQKLLQHQMKAPPSLAAIDRTLPAGMAKIVGRMLAKNPDDRLQTPADVIAELVPWLPNTNKLMSSLSRTDLSSSPKLRQTLDKVVSNSAARLNTETSDSITEGNEGPEGKPKKTGSSLVIRLVVGIALLVIGGGLLLAYSLGAFDSPIPRSTRPSESPATIEKTPVSSAASTPTTKATATSSPTTQTPPTLTPPTPKPKPPEVKLVIGVTYELDLSSAKPYSEKGGIVVPDPLKPAMKIWETKSKSGDGALPLGWKPRCWSPDSEVEFLVDTFDGSKAVGFRNLSGPPSAMLHTNDCVVTSEKMKLLLEYQTVSEPATYTLKFRPITPSPSEAFEVAKLEASIGKWNQKELIVDLKNATSGYFEFHNSRPKGAFWIRSFQLSQPDFSTQQQIWSMNLSKQQPFVQRAIAVPGAAVPVKILSETGPGKMPLGWYRWIEHANSEVEFFAEGEASKMAFGIRTMTGVPSVMATAPEFKTPQDTIKVRVVYQAGGNNAVLSFRPTLPTKAPVIEVAKLSQTGGSWRALVVDLNTKGATGGLFELYNTSQGPEGVVKLRELYVFEKPKAITKE